jgi:Ca-activated chloride channel homolog
MRKILPPATLIGALAILSACIPVSIPFTDALRSTPTPSLCAPALRIVAASEVHGLEEAGVFADFTRETCIQLAPSYKGSVDIKNMVAAYGVNNRQDVDVFWAASPIGLPGSLVNAKSIVMKTYPALVVDRQKAAELGWDSKKGIESRDIIAAIRAGTLTLAMPSASQDDAGAIFYLAFLSSLKGGIVQAADLSSPTITEAVKTLFGGVGRGAASADALQGIIMDDRSSGKPQYAAAMLPEVMAISLNRALAAKNIAPMTVFYIRDATDIETFPLGYVEKIGDTKIAQFNKLVAYLKSSKVQERLKALGWRTNPVGMTVPNADPAVFNPNWGIQADAEFAPIIMPKEAVIDDALALYQSAFRKPSYTVYCLDYSGSMSGDGEKQLKNAMDLILDQTRATTVLLQAGPQDVTVVLAFSTSTTDLGTVTGQDAATLKRLSKTIEGRRPDGGTALFSCIRDAIERIANGYNLSKFNYSVIAMTDGQSNAGLSDTDFVRYYQNKRLAVPVFGIAFGDADLVQMNRFKTLRAGDVLVPGAVCDGRAGGESLVLCFRQAKGSN